MTTDAFRVAPVDAVQLETRAQELGTRSIKQKSKVEGLRLAISMIWPRPPRVRPAPAEPERNSLRQNTTGRICSAISTGVPLTPDGNAVADRPSDSGLPPVPPLDVKVVAKP